MDDKRVRVHFLSKHDMFFGKAAGARADRIDPKWIDPEGERCIWDFCGRACAE